MEQWFLIGDIHGSTNEIEYFYNQNKERLNLDHTDNYLIILGDVGINMLNGNDIYKKKQLSKLPFTYICLRGNHESRVLPLVIKNREKWDIIHKYKGTIYVEKEFPHIEYLEDIISIYEFNHYKTLICPGAVSIDKEYRLSHDLPYFKDELLNEEELQQGRTLIQNQSFDLILSHTCPLFYEPKDLFIKTIDQSKIDKSMEIFLDEIEINIQYKRWAFGHFHGNRLYKYNNGKQMMLLYNQFVIDLDKFMHMNEHDYFDDIIA